MNFGLWMESTIGKAGIFFTDGSKFLILKRNNHWTKICGELKKKESEIDGAERIAKSAVGKVEGRNFATIVENDSDHISFLYKIKKPFKCELSKEYQDYKWIAFGDVDSYRFDSKTKEYLQKHIDLSMNLKEDGDLNAFSTTDQPDPGSREQFMKWPKSKKALKLYGKL